MMAWALRSFFFLPPCCELGWTAGRTFGDIFLEVFEGEQVDAPLAPRVEVGIVERFDFGRHRVRMHDTLIFR